MHVKRQFGLETSNLTPNPAVPKTAKQSLQTTSQRGNILLRILLRNTPSSKNNSPPSNYKRHVYGNETNFKIQNPNKLK